MFKVFVSEVNEVKFWGFRIIEECLRSNELNLDEGRSKMVSFIV